MTLREMWEAYEVGVLGGPVPYFTSTPTERQQRWQQRRAFYQGVYTAVTGLSALEHAPGTVAENTVAGWLLEYRAFLEDMKQGRA